MSRVTGIILGGGGGMRMNSSVPKQFLYIGGKPIIVYTIEAFQRCSVIDEVIVVMHKNWIKKTQRLVSEYHLSKVSNIIPGGNTRMDSSYKGLLYLKESGTEIIVIHDAVRPFVTQRIIKESVVTARRYGAVDVAVKTTDTIVNAKNRFIQGMPDRRYLFNGQTPQTFKYDLILKAHKFARKNNPSMVTDDARLVLNMKKKVRIVNGDYENIKLTTKADIELAETIIKRKKLYRKR